MTDALAEALMRQRLALEEAGRMFGEVAERAPRPIEVVSGEHLRLLALHDAKRERLRALYGGEGEG
jgi:hypothetical protein